MKTETQRTDTNAIIERSASDPTNTWLKLVEYGEHDHSRGKQIFTRKTAQRLVDNFNSLGAKLARHFGGLPIYIGHPDDEEFKGQPGHTDTRAYGWVIDMQARPGGLYILPKWSAEGKKIIENAYYKYLSPRWTMERVGHLEYEPTKLLSVGMTNNPNIEGETIANSMGKEKWQIAQAFEKKEPVSKSLIFNNQSSNVTAKVFFEKVDAHMQKTGSSYLRAWATVRDEHPDIFSLTFNS